MKKAVFAILIFSILLACVPVFARPESTLVTIMNCDTGRLITDANGNTQFTMVTDDGQTTFTDSNGSYLSLDDNSILLSGSPVRYTITLSSYSRYQIQLANNKYIYDTDEGTTNAATISTSNNGELINRGWFISPVSEGRPLRVLTIGDSLTYGVDLDLSGTSAPRVAYRKTLSNNLINYFGEVAFVGNVDEYVTSITEPYLYRHSGYSGYVIEDVYHVELHPGVKPMVDDMMVKYQPDIVIMMLGTNDLGLATMTNEIIPRWENFVRQIESQLPENGMIICSAIPPMKNSTKVPMFNEKIQAGVLRLANEGLKVGFADPYTPLNESPSVYLNSDGVHFNSRGYQVIGTVFAESITTAFAKSGEKISPNPLIPADPYAEPTEEETDSSSSSPDIPPVVWVLIGLGAAIIATVLVLVLILKKRK